MQRHQTVRLDKKTHEKAKIAAIKAGITLQEYVCIAVRTALKAKP